MIAPARMRAYQRLQWGGAIAAMAALRVTQPPAGADPLEETRDRFASEVKIYFARWMEALRKALEGIGFKRDHAIRSANGIVAGIQLTRRPASSGLVSVWRNLSWWAPDRASEAEISSTMQKKCLNAREDIPPWHMKLCSMPGRHSA